jgi:hypothetical protein
VLPESCDAAFAIGRRNGHDAHALQMLADHGKPGLGIFYYERFHGRTPFFCEHHNAPAQHRSSDTMKLRTVPRVRLRCLSRTFFAGRVCKDV